MVFQRVDLLLPACPVTEILVRRKNWSGGTKIPGIMVRLDHFPLKNLVRTWNNGPSTMFDRNRRL